MGGKGGRSTFGHLADPLHLAPAETGEFLANPLAGAMGKKGAMGEDVNKIQKEKKTVQEAEDAAFYENERKIREQKYKALDPKTKKKVKSLLLDDTVSDAEKDEVVSLINQGGN